MVGVITDLIAVATTRGLSEQAAQTCRDLAAGQPDAVIEVVRTQLGDARYRATAAFAADKTIVDESSTRTGVAEVTANDHHASATLTTTALAQRPGPVRQHADGACSRPRRLHPRWHHRLHRQRLATGDTGLSMPYSNGSIEGTNSKFTLLKRQMCGRAGFALLQQRILLS